MKRENIGKIQLSIGLFLFIMSIIGIIFDYQITNNRLNEYAEEINIEFKYLVEEFNNKTNEYSNESKQNILYHKAGAYSDLVTFTITNSINIGIGLFLTSLISLLILTQGLVNIYNK